MRKTTQNELSVRYYIGDNDMKLLNRLADEIEGICGPEGFVIPGTSRFISRSAPYLDKNENGGITRVLVRYEVDIYVLQTGDEIMVRVDNVNRLGAMTSFRVDDTVIASILLPNDLQEEDVPRDMFHRDHMIQIRLLDLRFGIGWDKITAVGKVIDDRNVVTSILGDHPIEQPSSTSSEPASTTEW